MESVWRLRSRLTEWSPLTAFRRNPSSFHNDNPESTEDVKKDVLEKALTCKQKTQYVLYILYAVLSNWSARQSTVSTDIISRVSSRLSWNKIISVKTVWNNESKNEDSKRLCPWTNSCLEGGNSNEPAFKAFSVKKAQSNQDSPGTYENKRSGCLVLI